MRGTIVSSVAFRLALLLVVVISGALGPVRSQPSQDVNPNPCVYSPAADSSLAAETTQRQRYMSCLKATSLMQVRVEHAEALNDMLARSDELRASLESNRSIAHEREFGPLSDLIKDSRKDLAVRYYEQQAEIKTRFDLAVLEADQAGIDQAYRDFDRIEEEYIAGMDQLSSDPQLQYPERFRAFSDCYHAALMSIADARLVDRQTLALRQSTARRTITSKFDGFMKKWRVEGVKPETPGYVSIDEVPSPALRIDSLPSSDQTMSDCEAEFK